MTENVERIIREGHLLIQPLRYKIINLLQENREGIFAKDLCGELGVTRTVLMMSFRGLLQFEFVMSKYENVEGKTLKKYFLNEKTDKALSDLKEIL